MVSIDASEMMVEKTANLTGQPAQYMRFDELPFAAEFDGIWACASLLHVPRQDTKTVWSILLRAMKPGAVWYMSFKEGLQEEIRNGRCSTTKLSHRCEPRLVFAQNCNV